MTINEIASAIYNDVVSGLRGMSGNTSMSIDQLEDEIIEERLVVIKEMSINGILNNKDIMNEINCIKLDCRNMIKCCDDLDVGKKVLHFEIPQLINYIHSKAISFIGSVDKRKQFVFYTDSSYLYHEKRSWGGNKPYVYIDCVPNKNDMYDCYLFNSPYTKMISLVGAFKDPRDISKFDCCSQEDTINFSAIVNEIKKRLTAKKINYYRSLAAPITPNDQIPK